MPGFHQVTIDFCDCRMNGIVPHHIQLLQAGWFPSTFNHPQTAFTFCCLNFYHELTLQRKVNAYDFCQSLLRLTDSLELNKTSVCFFFKILFLIQCLLSFVAEPYGRHDPTIDTITYINPLELCHSSTVCDKGRHTKWCSHMKYYMTNRMAV